MAQVQAGVTQLPFSAHSLLPLVVVAAVFLVALVVAAHTENIFLYWSTNIYYLDSK